MQQRMEIQSREVPGLRGALGAPAQPSCVPTPKASTRPHRPRPPRHGCRDVGRGLFPGVPLPASLHLSAGAAAPPRPGRFSGAGRRSGSRPIPPAWGLSSTGQWQRLAACEPGPHLVGPAGGNSWAHVLRASLSFQQMLRPSVQQLGAPSLGQTARRVSSCSPKHSCPRWDGAGGVEREGELVPPQKKQGTQARISQRTEPHALPD